MPTRIVTGLAGVRRAPARAVVTVGVFDGVHVAHRQLIRSTIRRARALRGTSVVVTFDPDPQRVLQPRHAHPALMPIEERLRRLAALGVGLVWVIPFTRRFARMTAAQFVQRILLGKLRARALIVGDQFTFGRGRGGDMTMLRRLGPPRGMRIVSVHAIRRRREPVSSSRIRRLVASGALASARALLGQPPEIYGAVVRGAGRGRSLGFPTANIRFIDQALPPRGVYAVRLRRMDRAWSRWGVMNLGTRPTFGGGPLISEVHVPEFSGSLLGRPVAVALLARLRDERCFPSIASLQRQIRTDIRRARRLLLRSS